jgi:hypothetical protein
MSQPPGDERSKAPVEDTSELKRLQDEVAALQMQLNAERASHPTEIIGSSPQDLCRKSNK